MAWGISHKYKFIFIHIPKTAGTTICSREKGSLLGDICKETGWCGGFHKTAMELKTRYPKEFDQYLKFTVVRNPYERLVSAFFFREIEFEIKWPDSKIVEMLPQLYWITDDSEQIAVDKILHFETLKQDLTNLFDKFGLNIDLSFMPHLNKRRRLGEKATYLNYYDNKFRSLAAYVYREDLRRLKYSWQDFIDRSK